jgi:hypothetical protein
VAVLRTFESPFALTIWEGGEHEFVLHLGYFFTPGYPDSYDEPGASDSIEIVRIRLLKPDGTKEYDVPVWMQALIDNDESLTASLMADAREDIAYHAEAAAEYRAEADRDDRMMSGRL